MEKNNFLILSEMHQNLKEERDGILEKVNKNLNRIDEMDSYIKSILEKEDSDYKVFSPRNVEVVYKEQLDSCRAEKYSLENENRNYYKQINKIGRYLDDLSVVLEENQTEEVIYAPEQENEEKITVPTLNLQVMDIQEKERQRIARDLHDITLQNLTHLIHKIELGSMFIDQDPIRAKLELAAVSKSLKTTITDIRNIIFDLRPMSFDDLGLKDSLTNFFTNLRKETNFNIEFDIGDIECRNELILITIFRVIQEASMNAIYHSDGNLLNVEVKEDNSFYHIVIKDNGKGFKFDDSVIFDKRHFGLAVMKERVEILKGKINIESNNEIGTKIEIYLPMSCQGEEK